jgi:hypothetical protein
MNKPVLLTKEKHRDIYINTAYSRELGDSLMSVPTFALEFRNLQPHYPILFQKDPETARFFPVVLFGLEQGENLFLKNNMWDCTYIPLMAQKGPFSIGLYGDGDIKDKQRLIHIDMDHPKVNTSEGLRLFEVHGGVTEYLEKSSGLLDTIHNFSEHNKEFMKELVAKELLESVTVDITLANGHRGQLFGYYTIKEERMAELNGNELQSLNEKGFLFPIYMEIASLPNIRKLIERKSA